MIWFAALAMVLNHFLVHRRERLHTTFFPFLCATYTFKISFERMGLNWSSTLSVLSELSESDYLTGQIVISSVLEISGQKVRYLIKAELRFYLSVALNRMWILKLWSDSGEVSPDEGVIVWLQLFKLEFIYYLVIWERMDRRYLEFFFLSWWI